MNFHGFGGLYVAADDYLKEMLNRAPVEHEVKMSWGNRLSGGSKDNPYLQVGGWMDALVWVRRWRWNVCKPGCGCSVGVVWACVRGLHVLLFCPHLLCSALKCINLESYNQINRSLHWCPFIGVGILGCVLSV